ncbi:ferritin family protein [Halobacillus massiliensis]|uniref:ferritin family protein n=1 Tax=Halobacillus massiliensis TaxID=1926286 RepID=UPI0009E46DEC
MYTNPYYYQNYPYYAQDYQRTRDLTADLQKAINGEYTAITCYEKLAEMAPDEQTKEKILEIRGDEERHFQTFSSIYTQLTGQQYTPELVEECPGTFAEGIDSAFKDEQNTVDFYLDIAENAPNQFVKESFHRAAADEQNHAVWFLYFLNKL